MRPDDAQLTPAGVVPAWVDGWRAGARMRHSDWLAEEVPVALVFNGISHAVMLASPADLEDFALGFGLSEGLLAHPAELYGVDLEQGADGIEVHMEVAAACEMRMKERRRTLAGRTGCGLCGTDSLAQVKPCLRAAPAVATSPAAVTRAQRELRMHQAMQQLTGAAHAAAWCGLDGAVRLVREDIGRHNALDKLIGAMCCARVDAGAYLLPSRRRRRSRCRLRSERTSASPASFAATTSSPTPILIASASAPALPPFENTFYGRRQPRAHGEPHRRVLCGDAGP